MSQSRRWSFIEAVTNVVVGYGLAVVAQAMFLQSQGADVRVGATLLFSGIMTLISVVRSFSLRRVFNRIRR